MGLTRERKLVRDLMQVGVTTVPPTMPVRKIAELMLERSLDAVIVLDPDDGHAVGVISQVELVKAYIQDNAQTLVASNIMSEDVPQAPPDIPLKAACEMMIDQRQRTFFLMHHAGGAVYPAAFLSFFHILRHLLAEEETDLQGLGIEAKRNNPVEMYIERRDAARRRLQIQRQE